MRENIHTQASRHDGLRRRQYRRIDGARRQRRKPLRRAAAREDGHRLARDIPFFEGEGNRQVGGTAEIENADFLADEVGRLADFLLRHDAKGEFVQRGGDYDDVATAQTYRDGRARRALGKVGASGDQSCHAPRAARDQNHLCLQAMFLKQLQVLGRPQGPLKTGIAVIADNDAFLRTNTKGYR